MGWQRAAGLAGPDPRRRYRLGRTLFDDYQVCPHRTRLQSGEIADLTLSRNTEEDEGHAAWTTTNPGNWRLGAGACQAALVAILDDNDGSPVARSLGTRKVTFDKVGTGTEVTVQLAIVMEAADGSWLISDVLEQTLNQSLTESSFTTGWRTARCTTSATTRTSATTAPPMPTSSPRRQPRACASAWPTPPTKPQASGTTWTSRPAASASRTETAMR